MECSEYAFSVFWIFNHHSTIIHQGPTVGFLGVAAYILDDTIAESSRYSRSDEPIGFKFGGTGVRSKSFLHLRRSGIAIFDARRLASFGMPDGDLAFGLLFPCRHQRQTSNTRSAAPKTSRKQYELTRSTLQESTPLATAVSKTLEWLAAKGRAGCLARPPARPFSDTGSKCREAHFEPSRRTGQSVGF